MRVIVVDFDLEMLERTARALRDELELDVTSSAADAGDLLRQNKFDLIVAGEHVADGSGLDLLSLVARRWPKTLRVLAVEPTRIEGVARLAERCELFESIAYPIDPDELRTILDIARNALDGGAARALMEHVVLESPRADASPTGTSHGAGDVLPLPNDDSPAARLMAAAGFVAVRAPAPSRKRAQRTPGTQAAPPPNHGVPASLLPDTPNGEANTAAAGSTPRPPTWFDVVRHPWAFAALVTVCVLLLLLILTRWNPADPGSLSPGAAARAQLDATARPVIERIELALVRDDYAHAREAVAELRRIDPAHPRLAFFDTMLRRADLARAGGTSSTRRRSPSSFTVTPRNVVASTGASTSEMAESVRSGTELTVLPSAAALASVSALPRPGQAAESHAADAARSDAAPDASASSTISSSPASVAAALPTSTTPAGPERRVVRDLADLPPVVREHRLLTSVAPDYPFAAVRDRIEGTVDVAFTITRTGGVRDVQVLQSEPAQIFDGAAMDAVKRWKFDPRIEDGVPVDYRTRTRLRFRLD